MTLSITNIVFVWLSAFSIVFTNAEAWQQLALSPDPGPILGETGFESTLKYCPESRDDDLFPIELLQIHPNPPVMCVTSQAISGSILLTRAWQ